MKKILLIYTSRADFYLLNHLYEELERRDDCEAQIKLWRDHYCSIDQGEFDWCVLLGDRYETIMAAVSCVRNRLPIAHIHGGERTYGSMDEYWRHAITKLSNLHFVATCDAKEYVVCNLDEPEETVHHVGAIGAEMAINNVQNITRKKKTILVTFHPDTINGQAEFETIQLINALPNFIQEGYHLIITKPNLDPGHEEVEELLETFADSYPEWIIYTDGLGAEYHKVCDQSMVVVGNSSSGLIEVPTLGTPTVNIRDRQRGREHGDSVINCYCGSDAIESAIREALTDEYQQGGFTNPYYDGQETTKNIADILLSTEPVFGKGEV